MSRSMLKIAALTFGLALCTAPANSEEVIDHTQDIVTGLQHVRAGNYDLGLTYYTRAIESGTLDRHNLAIAYFNRATAYYDKGKIGKAIDDFTEAINSGGLYGNELAAAYSNRGLSHRDKGAHALALANHDEAVLLAEPDDAYAENIYANRGLTRGDMGNYVGALADFDEAIRINPKFADAYSNKAWLLATCPDANIRNGVEALTLAEKALTLEDGPYIHATLAAAYAETGQYGDAVKHQEIAIELLSKNGSPRQKGDLSDFRHRLKLYRQNTPYRESSANS